jgi:zinc transport system substrate-binding protein
MASRSVSARLSRASSLLWTLLLFASIGAFGCAQKSDHTPQNEQMPSALHHKPVVYTVNYPLSYFAERIGGQGIEVVFPTPAGLDPAFWNPAAEDVLRYQSADLILLNGADYAKWVERATLPPEKLVDTSASFADSFIVIPNAITHSHGPSGKHSHAGTVFTTWIDFTQANRQARAVYEAFIAHGFADSLLLRRNFDALQRDLLELDSGLRALTRGHAGDTLFVSHPIYQYFARRYDLNLISMLWEPGEYPDQEQWDHLAELQQKRTAKWMIWEGEPLPASQRKLLQMAIRSVVFDPCANRPSEGDFLSVMRANLENLRAVFSD